MTVSAKSSFESAVDVSAVRRGVKGKMRQPAGDIEGPRTTEKVEAAVNQLYEDAALAQEVMNRIGAFMAERFKSEFSARPSPKDQGRLIDKGDQRYQGDYSYTSDMACIMLKMPQYQIRNVIDQLCGDNEDSRALQAELKKLGMLVMDPAENRISYPDHSGLRNLATNLAVAITRKDGTRTYHVCEIQCVHEKSVPLYKLSHESFEHMRDAQTAYLKADARRMRYEAEQTKAAREGQVGFRVLEMMQDRIDRAAEEHMFHKKAYEASKAAREKANLEATRITGNPGINAFLGYQPRSDSMAENLAVQPPKGIQSRQLAAHPA